MNSIKGQISQIETEGSFSLITIEAQGQCFRSIIINNGQENYSVKEELTLHFKETEVAIATAQLDHISLQNQISGKVKSIDEGQLLSRIILETDFGPIASVITTASTKRLGLTKGLLAYALIKTNEVMLSKE